MGAANLNIELTSLRCVSCFLELCPRSCKTILNFVTYGLLAILALTGLIPLILFLHYPSDTVDIF